MKTLRALLQEAENKRVAIGHFNFSELTVLKAVAGAARELNVPVIVGVSEGERQLVGVTQAAALVRSPREDLGHPIFLNADHTHSLEGAEQAAKAGFDMIVFDRSEKPMEENMQRRRALWRRRSPSFPPS